MGSPRRECGKRGLFFFKRVVSGLGAADGAVALVYVALILTVFVFVTTPVLAN